MRIVELLNTVLPEDVLHAVPGSRRNVGQPLAAHPLVRMVSFTGSTGATPIPRQGLAGRDRPGARPAVETYRLKPHADGTRFTYDHTGFTGAGGLFMSQLLGHVRRKMLNVGLPALLDDLDEDGALRPDSALKPKPLG
jgi:hypothetical protein